ncbi:MAG: hypothetical protein JWL76_1720 [Thermoleophilia bacterium]|nr:hypothetical protein [Thermoleophilia bacterium]
MRRLPVFLLTTAALAGALPAGAIAAPRVIHVDPVHGRDAWPGTTPARAKRTVTAAWNSIPLRRTLTQGVTIRLAPGTYAPTATPNYWESRWGSRSAPIVIESRTGIASSVRLPSINMFGVRFLKLQNVSIQSKFDPFHCEQCADIVLRDSVFAGIGNPSQGQGPQETIKVNQSTGITLIGNDISGATDNAIDFVAVQRGLVARNRIHRATDWCTYVKGGSASIVIEQNHVHDCGTGGITAGQGTGLEFMTAPWVHYEAYDVAIRSNVLHDIEGAGVGVNGGYDVVVAHNTMQRVGSRDHVIEAVFGERSCDGNAAACASRVAAGAWGPPAPGGDPVYIGNRGVRIANNLVVNPAPYRSQFTHFAIYQPRPLPAGGAGPDPAVADDELRITGNVISNGPDDLELGVGPDQGCQDTNPTCNAVQLRADNTINAGAVDATDVFGALAPGAGLLGATVPAIPPFAGDDPSVPTGTIPDAVTTDRDGRARTGTAPVGAYIARPLTSALTVRANGPSAVSVGAVGAVARRTCPSSTCSYQVLRGDWVELRAITSRTWRVSRWLDACAGTVGSTCVVHATTGAVRARVIFVSGAR